MGRPDLDYAGLFDASPNPYLVLDRALNIVGANRAYLDATKRELADIVGRWAWDAFPTDPDTLRQSVASFERVLRTGKLDTMALLRFDISRPEAEGGGFEERYWSIVHSPVLDASGEVSLVLQHPIDVTELQRLRGAARYTGEERRFQPKPAYSGIFDRAQAVYQVNLSLQAESDRLRGLFEQAPGFMCVVRGPEHRFDLANAAYLQLVGNRSLLGRPVREALPELEGQGFFELLDQVYATGEAFTARRASINFASGLGGALDQRFVDFVYQPIRDAAGAVTGIFVEGSDVTEAALADEALREREAQLRELNDALERKVEARTRELAGSEARFRAYFDASPESLFLARVPADGSLVYDDLNPAAEALYGLPRDAVVGRAPARVLDAATAADVERRARECLRLGRPLRYETERRFQSGRTMVLNVVAAPLPAPEGGDALVMFCVRDVTEQRQAEEALRQSQKMEAVGQLTGGIAHDFNNMLQAIGGGLEMVQRRIGQARTEDAARYVDSARTTVARAAGLTHRLLAFARRQALQPRPVDADKLIQELEDLVQRTAGPAITVELQMRDGRWPVLCDPNQLENVLLNLAINARDAMPDGGRLTIATRDVHLLDADTAGQEGAKPGDFVEILVADTGTGMDEATRARAFEPFFTTKPIGQGTGLGLSQMYGFVRQSDGVVRLDSAPGLGTAVRLYLPRREPADGQDAAAEPDVAPAEAGRGETVLLVEDEAEVRAATSERLRDLGYVVLEAADGPGALRLLRSGACVDVLVTDVGLPGGMNGQQVADAVRERRPGLPALFITGYAGSVLDGQLGPGMEVIGKPFALDALAARIRTMLDAAPAAQHPAQAEGGAAQP